MQTEFRGEFAQKENARSGGEPGVLRKDKSAPERHRKGGVSGAGSSKSPPHGIDMGRGTGLAKSRRAIFSGHISVKDASLAQMPEAQAGFSALQDLQVCPAVLPAAQVAA